jgi:hypothetical protein
MTRDSWAAGAALRVLVWLAAVFAVAAFAQTATRSFDHLQSGFALTGEHARARCEACHQNGIFKGTPRDCASCHQTGQRFSRGNVVMPARHLATQQSCEVCHATTTFVGARFSHAGVASGTCQNCHNGTIGKAKPATHMPTSASCDGCHRTTGWLPVARVDHSGFAPGGCVTCHNGTRAQGKPAQHMPVGAAQSCNDCHKAFTGWRPTAWNHTQVTATGQCASCHSGGYPPADGKPGNHIPYQAVAAAATANCDGCHRGSFTTWTNGKFHANYSIAGNCATCHTGGYLNAAGRPANAIHSGATSCEGCHTSTSTWTGAKVDHSAFNATTNCSGCHDGRTATGLSAAHTPIGATGCLNCHSTTAWTPTKWNHTQVTVVSQCASCHTGGYPPADGKPANHVPYQTVAVTAAANCDGCHRGSYTTWANGRFHANYSVSTGCASCHTGSYLNAVGKPANATHATVTGNCESCHRSTTNWAAASVDHGTFNATTNCSQCHGVSATGKPANHIPTTANCYLCHNVAPQGWTPTKWNHTQVTVVSQCASCHTGGYPPADGKPANHVPYQTVAVTAAANCDGCHRGSYTTWANGKVHMYYSLSSGCRNCHTGAYLQATGKPANHIPEVQLLNGAAMDCSACHTSAASWGSMTMNHNGSQGSGAGWCKACHQSGTSYLGSMERKALTHRSATAVDCSQSGCHRPLGTKGTPYTRWE